MSETDGSLAPGDRRRQRAIVIAAIALAVVLLSAFAVVVADDGEQVGTSETTTSTATTASTTTLRFDAPPAQVPGTVTTAPETTTSTTTTSTTTTTTPPPVTTPPPRARPGPTVETSSGRHQAMRAALAEARTRWNALDRSSGYVFRTRVQCFCPAQDNEVTVDEAGRVTGQRTMAGDREASPPSIDDVFDEIDAAVVSDVASIAASFDRESGFPVEVSIDPDELVADDERGRTIVWVLFRTATG